jgi:hypothetical protein
MDALLSLDPDATWLDFVSQVGPRSVDQVQILTHSNYGSQGSADMFQLSELMIQLIKGTKVFISAGPAAGLVQIFYETFQI